MSDQPRFTQPGSTSYTSKTMHVGDGTWDSVRDTFLLPNIQGLNFATMRYNGMGNRFQALPEYHQLISAHGIIAAITFLGIVPAAILTAKFYHTDPHLALRIHITFMILTILLATVILVLGYFAVGPERSLSNPHHGIGVAIYVLVLIQAIGGAIIRRIEKGKKVYYIPVKMMLHQWFGRGIALLALAQIPIGLTLYGSPLFLFILYALLMAAYLTLYFILSHRDKRREGLGYYERGSYLTGTQTDMSHRRSDSHHPSRLAALAGAVGAGGALEALRRRRSDRDRRTDAAGSAVGSRPDSASYLTDKYSDDSRDSRDHTWRNRIFGGLAGVGAVTAVKKFMDRRRDRDRPTEYQSDMSNTRYDDRFRPPPAPPLGGHVSHSTHHVNMMEEGFPGAYPNPQNPNQQYPSQQYPNQPYPNQQYRSVGPSGPPPLSAPDPEAGTARANAPAGPTEESILTPSSQLSREYEPQGPLDRIAEFTGLGGFLRRRRERKEQDRVDAERQRDYENERMFGRREEEPLYPGDGSPRRDGVRFNPRSSSGPPHASRFGQAPIEPVPAPGTAGYGYDPPPPPPQQNIPPPPRGGPPGSRGISSRPPLSTQSTGALPSMGGPEGSGQTTQRGPPVSNTINNTINNNVPRSGPVATGGLQEPPAVASPGRDRNSSSASDGNLGSPPLSLRLQMHNDRAGNVTFRRLDQQETAGDRGSSQDRARAGGYNNMPSTAAVNNRQQATPPAPSTSGQQYASPGATGAPVGSPSVAGGYDTTDSYETNRKRRRAERARAEQARQAARNDAQVDFT